MVQGAAQEKKYAVEFGSILSQGTFPTERRKLPEPVLAVQERERQRIAMDLHDGLGQVLTLMKLELMAATKLLATGMYTGSEAEASLQRLSGKLHYAFDELRRTVMDLRPSMLDDLGILPTLSWFFREFAASGADIVVDKDITVQEHEVPAALKIVIFRILQEAVSNTVKHARASRIRICFRKNGGILELFVEDNGCGFNFDRSSIFQRSSGGIAGIIERTQISGGEWSIASDAGHGTCIHVAWACS